MKTMRTTAGHHHNQQQLWFFWQLLCLLLGGSASSSPLFSSPQSSISYRVGEQAVLPCSWKSRLGDVTPSICHVQWTTPADMVFELRGHRKWQAEEFQGRAEVPEERLGSGDCSLIIHDVQNGDTGRYHSFMVVDGARASQQRVSIQTVKLSVFDHKSKQERPLGEDTVLDLHSNHSVRLVYLGRNSSEWSTLWLRGEPDSGRLQLDPVKLQLKIKQLRSSDAGTYRVLDAHGLPVSTVQLSVTEDANPRDEVEATQLHFQADDAGIRSSCSALLFTSLLLLHLL